MQPHMAMNAKQNQINKSFILTSPTRAQLKQRPYIFWVLADTAEATPQRFYSFAGAPEGTPLRLTRTTAGLYLASSSL